MIRLSATRYHLEGVSEKFFWKELEKITSGQRMNPEFRCNPPYQMSTERIFAGRKAGNQFSIFLRRSMSLFRTPILCKGTVSAEGYGITVKCSFEYPFGSLIALIVLALWVFVKFDPIPFANELLVGTIGIALYGFVVVYNHSSVKREMAKQLELIEEKAKQENAALRS